MIKLSNQFHKLSAAKGNNKTITTIFFLLTKKIEKKNSGKNNAETLTT